MAIAATDEARMQAWEALLLAHAALIGTLNDELIRERDMPLTWYDVLIQLADHGGRMRMQGLAHSILFSKSGLTRLIDRMEHAGAVRRDSCAEDGRGTLAVITPSGRRQLAKARPVHHRGIAEHFAQHLTDQEAAALTSGLRTVARRLRPDIE